MIGPTGVGKTEISRRLARLAGAPFLKVEATKFTEVGYVGRDVEQIVRDLVEISIALTRERKRKDVQAQAPNRTPKSACSMPWSAPAPARHARELPQEAARRRTQRQGNRDRGAVGRRRHADVRNSRHAGRADGRHQSSANFRQARRRPHQDAARHRAGFARHPGQRGIRQALGQRPAHPGIDQGGRAERHRLPRRDRQDRRRARAAWAPTCRARACSATCCR